MSKLVERARSGGWLRMRGWAIVAVLTSVGLLALSPQQLGVVLAKANLLALGAWLGYWVDRSAFQELRITVHSNDAECLRRAIIIGSSMIAMALAL